MKSNWLYEQDIWHYDQNLLNDQLPDIALQDSKMIPCGHKLKKQKLDNNEDAWKPMGVNPFYFTLQQLIQSDFQNVEHSKDTCLQNSESPKVTSLQSVNPFYFTLQHLIRISNLQNVEPPKFIKRECTPSTPILKLEHSFTIPKWSNNETLTSTQKDRRRVTLLRFQKLKFKWLTQDFRESVTYKKRSHFAKVRHREYGKFTKNNVQ